MEFLGCKAVRTWSGFCLQLISYAVALVFFFFFFLGKPKVASLFLSGMLGKTVIEIEREKTELVTSVNKAAYPN